MAAWSISGTQRYDSAMPYGETSGRTSPPTERVVAVLDFLAHHPHDRFGLSELARRLDLSKPTCLGIHTAQESMRVDPAAREELRLLSSGYSTTVALSAVIDDRITLLELVGPPGAD